MQNSQEGAWFLNRSFGWIGNVKETADAADERILPMDLVKQRVHTWPSGVDPVDDAPNISCKSQRSPEKVDQILV